MENIKSLSSDAMLDNLKFIRSACHGKICAMVKANAYGHGLKQVVEILSDKVEAFGVANLQEALEVRRINKSQEVIIFGKCDNIHKAIEKDISLSIISVEELENILKISKKVGKKAKLHLNINSGMNRFGIKDEQDFVKIMELLEQNDTTLQGIFTHFSSLTTSHEHTHKQKEIFDKFISLLPKKYRPIVHVGGGQSVFSGQYDMHRVGLLLYGYGHKNVKPVMEISSQIIAFQDVKKGENVGYMCAYTAPKDMRVAVVPVGYADGLKRKLSNNFYVEINGKKCANVGNICMDCFMVDVSQTECKLGDKVVVMDNATSLATPCQTTEYEILTNFSPFRGRTIII